MRGWPGRAARILLAGAALGAGAASAFTPAPPGDGRGASASASASASAAPACRAGSGLPAGFGPGSEAAPNRAGMKPVPVGRFVPGADAGYAEERGGREVALPAFLIDEHEVTNAQFAAFVRATGYITEAERAGASAVFVAPRPGEAVVPYGWWKQVRGADWRHPQGPGSGIAGKAAHPVVQVSLADAEAYARWLGRRLPTEAQWEYAALGGLTGRAARLANAFEGNTAEFQRLLRRTANTWQGSFPDRDRGADGWRGTAPAGCFAANGYGLSDMVGNVWELTRDGWTGDHAADDPDAVRPDGRAPEGRATVMKGGSFLCSPDFCVRYRPASRQPLETGLATSHVGFRTVVTD
ncbi:formylglycine-generating enzyme family protein [Derxia gummosa]|uniref:Formylglycine-generating enzyme family protein n=1 Tax=Derxia gummosa DSM 723 TaxID=1121388 RepID=A0A8B6X7U0_9BURK|nr:formylglycine-generating enzyme family protein [Derxia gummosa]